MYTLGYETEIRPGGTSPLWDIVPHDQLRAVRQEGVAAVELEDVRAVVIVIVQDEAQAELGAAFQVDIGVGSCVENGLVPA